MLLLRLLLLLLLLLEQLALQMLRNLLLSRGLVSVGVVVDTITIADPARRFGGQRRHGLKVSRDRLSDAVQLCQVRRPRRRAPSAD